LDRKPTHVGNLTEWCPAWARMREWRFGEDGLLVRA
jgi:hypothetical protein